MQKRRRKKKKNTLQASQNIPTKLQKTHTKMQVLYIHKNKKKETHIKNSKNYIIHTN